MKFSIEILNKYKEGGWIYSQVHPTLPLIIWNYSDSTQYGGYWDDITLNCRGLVTDQDGNVISKGFTKFFNYSENRTNIPEKIDYVRVYEKLDGSYIGLFYYDGQWIVNSKGSFDSDQSNWAKEILRFKELYLLNKTWTYCFELIVPKNRIVVNYGGRKELVFLKAFYNETGEEVPVFGIHGFTPVKNWLVPTFNPIELQEKNIKNEEGYVIQFPNGERCKIKFAEYVKLHSLYTRTSSYDIWNCIKDGDDIVTIIKDAPDEIYEWIEEVKSDIENDFNNLLTEIKSEYKTICLSLGKCSNKHFALFIKDNKYKSYLFALRNGRDITQQIYKDIKPKYKTFAG